MNQEENLAFVERTEALLGKLLPRDYRQCLATDVLNLPSDPEFCVHHPSGQWIDRVENLFGAEQVHTVVECERELLAQGYRDYPVEMLPIADNGCGDLILISLRDSNFGSVHYLFHEEAHPQEEGDKGVYLLAETYSKWFASLGKQAD